MMKSRKLAIGLLLLLSVVVTTGSFAYWASSVTVTNATDTATVTIGEGGIVTTTMNLGTITDDGSTDLNPSDSIVFTIPVTWNADAQATGTTGTLVVTELYTAMTGTGGSLSDNDLEIMFETSYAYSPSNAITIGGVVTVTITVLFENEPLTKAIYDTLVENDLELNLTFAITTN